jgi:hypothetical protein
MMQQLKSASDAIAKAERKRRLRALNRKFVLFLFSLRGRRGGGFAVEAFA